MIILSCDSAASISASVTSVTAISGMLQCCTGSMMPQHLPRDTKAWQWGCLRSMGRGAFRLHHHYCAEVRPADTMLLNDHRTRYSTSLHAGHHLHTFLHTHTHTSSLPLLHASILNRVAHSFLPSVYGEWPMLTQDSQGSPLSSPKFGSPAASSTQVG